MLIIDLKCNRIFHSNLTTWKGILCSLLLFWIILQQTNFHFVSRMLRRKEGKLSIQRIRAMNIHAYNNYSESHLFLLNYSTRATFEFSYVVLIDDKMTGKQQLFKNLLFLDDPNITTYRGWVGDRIYYISIMPASEILMLLRSNFKSSNEANKWQTDVMERSKGS